MMDDGKLECYLLVPTNLIISLLVNVRHLQLYNAPYCHSFHNLSLLRSLHEAAQADSRRNINTMGRRSALLLNVCLVAVVSFGFMFKETSCSPTSGDLSTPLIVGGEPAQRGVFDFKLVDLRLL